MNHRQFPIDPVTDARVIADIAEQVAQEMHRFVAAVAAMADDVEVLRKVMSPFVKWLSSTQVDPSAKV